MRVVGIADIGPNAFEVEFDTAGKRSVRLFDEGAAGLQELSYRFARFLKAAFMDHHDAQDGWLSLVDDVLSIRPNLFKAPQ